MATAEAAHLATLEAHATRPVADAMFLGFFLQVKGLLGYVLFLLKVVNCLPKARQNCKECEYRDNTGFPVR